MPSLQTLRVFEAAGRLQSYSRAGEELGLTHSAVSHRIRELEAHVGLRLFARRGNAMVPTVEGHRLLAQVRQATTLLESIFPPKRSLARRIVISVLPALASRWLVRRIGEFREQHPDADLVISPSADLVELGQGADAAIRYGPGSWPGTRSARLASEVLFPVCTPAYARAHRLKTPDDLGSCTLLRHPWQSWTTWLKAAKARIEEPDRGPSYADSDLLLEAAAAGEGIALGRGLLALDALQAGTLVAPFRIAIPDVYVYAFVTTESSPDPLLDELAGWLTARISRDTELVQQAIRAPNGNDDIPLVDQPRL